ncbi:MAG: hypothetical protein ACRC2S_28455 [Waterburya sp.]
MSRQEPMREKSNVKSEAEKLECQYAELERDPEFQAEVEAWDCVAGDGLDDEDG